ncbi:MAG: hypothetical protein LBD98_01890 [Endomicrobium sp.]|jgi:ribosomal protein L28|nr:hypothetical protein [Endomicrobium sp.]
MHYDQAEDKIVVNFFLARHLFFDEDGKNTKNKKLFHIFLKHELAHREFANPENKALFFIYKNFSWLEEFLVSFGDAFRPLNFQTMPQGASVDEVVEELLRNHKDWIERTFSEIFPNGVESLSDHDIKRKFNEAIKGENTPEALKRLSGTVTTKLIQEYFKRKEASQRTQQITQIESIPIVQEEEIDIDPRVEAFARLIRELPFEIQHSFVKAVLGNDALTARFIRIITTSNETKWKRELSVNETSVTDITDTIKASFTLAQGTMRTTEDGKIQFNLQEVQRSLESGRSGIISLTVKSMRELDHISYIEAKDFKGFKSGFKAFIHKWLGFLESTQIFIAGLWRFVSLHITTSGAARKFTTEWAGVSVAWIPPYGIDLPDTLQDARIVSIAAGISIEEAERISKLYTGLPQREVAIELLATAQGELSVGATSVQTSKLKPLSLFVANASGGSLISASSYADKFGGATSDYATAVVEHIPSNILVPTGYSRRMSVNVSFNGLVYDVYVRQNAQGKCFIGLKLKGGGADLEQNPTAAAQNFAAAAQYFANNLNTNRVLREELNRVTKLGISAEGVAMMDFVGFPPALHKQSSQQLTQQLYESGDMSQGLVGVYTAWGLEK